MSSIKNVISPFTYNSSFNSNFNFQQALEKLKNEFNNLYDELESLVLFSLEGLSPYEIKKKYEEVSISITEASDQTRKKISSLRKKTFDLKELEELEDFEDDVKTTFAILRFSTGFSTELYKKLSTL